MSTPIIVHVPREGNPSHNIVHQSTTYSEQTNAWLREGHKDVPWHNLDSIVTSSSNTSEPNTNTNASQNPATQGSAKEASSQPHMPHYFVHQRPTQNPRRYSRYGHDLTRPPELERQQKRHRSCTAEDSRSQGLCIGVLNEELPSSS